MNRSDTLVSIDDEYDLIVRKLPLRGVRLLELGCGDAAMSLRLAEGSGVKEILALEVDQIQLNRNLAKNRPVSLSFAHGAAECIDQPDASFDHVMMLKSLHHVPMAQMDNAFDQIHRVLTREGLVYISEPVFDGEFNQIMRLFHDEQLVREAAIAALARACDRGLFERVEQINFLAPVSFADFADFERRMMNLSHTQLDITESVRYQVRSLFESHMTPAGVRFERPMRVDLLRKRGS